MMTSHSADCLVTALACEEHAEHLGDPRTRALFLGIAHHWRDVAKQLRDIGDLDLSKTEAQLTRRSLRVGRYPSKAFRSKA